MTANMLPLQLGSSLSQHTGDNMNQQCALIVYQQYIQLAHAVLICTAACTVCYKAYKAYEIQRLCLLRLRLWHDLLTKLAHW